MGQLFWSHHIFPITFMGEVMELYERFAHWAIPIDKDTPLVEE